MAAKTPKTSAKVANKPAANRGATTSPLLAGGKAVMTQKDNHYPELTARLIAEFLDSR